MSRRIQFLLFGFLLALMLAVIVRPAEGFVYYEQRETAPPLTPQLTPSADQIIVDLGGQWDCTIGNGKSGRAVWVPGCYVGEARTVTFRRNFGLSDTLRSLHFQLVLPEINYSAEVWLNGRLLCSLTGFHLGFSNDIGSEQLRFGSQNEITIHVINSLNPWTTFPTEPLLFESENSGGLFAGVFLRGIPSWSIEEMDLEVGELSDSTINNATALVRIAQYGALASVDGGDSATSSSLYVSIRDSSGQLVADGSSADIAYRGNDANRLEIPISPFKAVLWSPTAPVRYSMSAYLIVGSDTLHHLYRQIGLRQVELKDGELLLNKKPFRVRGMDYVLESQGGRRAISPSQVREDLSRIRGLGMNTIRVPFAPPPACVLSAADATGLFVLVESGLSMIPSKILSADGYEHLVQQSVGREIAENGRHPCLLGWGLGSFLNWEDHGTQKFSHDLYQYVKSLDSHLCYIETNKIVNIVGMADFSLWSWDALGNIDGKAMPPDFPVIYSRVEKLAAGCEPDRLGTPAGMVNQAEYVLRCLSKIESDSAIGGFLIHAFSDYHGASPTLLQPGQYDPGIYTFGMVDFDRQERLICAKLRDLARSGQTSFPVPVASGGQSPFVFPIVGFGSLLLISLELRRNNVFRQNVKRTFFHAHGFYSDLRFRRFLHTGQPMVLWLFESLTLGLIVSSGLFSLRTSRQLDYYLSQFFPWPTAKAWLVGLLWDPTRSIIYLTAFFAAILVLIIVLIRFLSIFFRDRMDFRQVANSLIWSLASLLFLLPLAVVFYRAVQIPALKDILIVIMLMGFLWTVVRLMNALRTGFSTSVVRLYSVMIGSAATIIAVVLFLLEREMGALTYLKFFGAIFGSPH